MHPDPGFHHRLAAQTDRFLQRHKLGPAQPPRQLRLLLEEVHWISPEASSQRPDLDPLPRLHGAQALARFTSTILPMEDGEKALLTPRVIELDDAAGDRVQRKPSLPSACKLHA